MSLFYFTYIFSLEVKGMCNIDVLNFITSVLEIMSSKVKSKKQACKMRAMAYSVNISVT